MKRFSRALLTCAAPTTEGGARFIFGSALNAVNDQVFVIEPNTSLIWSGSLAASGVFLSDKLLTAPSGPQRYPRDGTLNFGPSSDAEVQVDELGWIAGGLQQAGGGIRGRRKSPGAAAAQASRTPIGTGHETPFPSRSLMGVAWVVAGFSVIPGRRTAGWLSGDTERS